jgi:hypothetical protein
MVESDFIGLDYELLVLGDCASLSGDYRNIVVDAKSD